MPETIVSDRDPRFTSLFWKAIWENIGTRLQFSSSFHPQTDGQSEIANSVVLDLLKSYISDQKTQWERCLPLVEFAYNNTIHSSTGKEPFEIVEGVMKVPPFLSTKDKILEANEYTRDLDTDFAKVRETLQKSQERQKKAADRHRRASKLKENDWVLLRFAKAHLRKIKGKEKLSSKLSMRYYGPFQITEQINDISFRLRLPDTWKIHNGPTVGDVDGDGTIDVVVPTVSGNIYVLNGKTGAVVKPYPFRTHGRVMAPVLLVDLGRLDAERRNLTLVVTSFDGYLYLIDGATGCADVIDVGETSYTMVLADNVDGGDDLDLIVTTMNGNVFCFSTPAPYHPLRSWTSQNQGRNYLAVRDKREGIYAIPGSRAFRDEGGESFWVQFNVLDHNRSPSGPYNVTATLLVPHNYMGPKRITQSQLIEQPGRHQFKLPCVSVRSSGTVILEMVDKNGFYFSDEFSLTFHMHYYRLLKWMVVLPMLGMFFTLLWLHPEEGIASLPSFSRDR
ncbi:hypothetical protein L7F22_030731 [Adiantum nelumboides]|nr:hypothetical protein [Adiantum nelumboides]